MTEFEHVRYAVEDGIATLTLYRPERLNAVNRAMLVEIVAALDAADGDDAVRAVIVTGAGRAFCAGADLAAGGQTFDQAARGSRSAAAEPGRSERAGGLGGSRSAAAEPGRSERTGGLGGPRLGPPSEEEEDGGGIVTLRVYDMSKPVIAAINGPAVGFGATFTLPMDIRIASTAARIGFVFARRGVVPEACSTWFLPRLVGIARAAEWVYTGRSADAYEGITAFLEKRPARFRLRPSVDMPPFFPWWRPRSFRSDD